MDREHVFDKTVANFLAEEVIRQYQEMPLLGYRVPIKKEALVAILMQAKGFNHKKRMQFPIPEPGTNKFPMSNGKHELGYFVPERIFANYETGFVPTTSERVVQEIENKSWKVRKEKFNPEVICRFMRDVPEITAIRKRSYDAERDFGVMVHLNTILPIKEGPPHYGGEISVDIPLFFIPKASKEDYDTLARFSILNQNPIDGPFVHCTEHGVFENRLYLNNREENDY